MFGSACSVMAVCMFPIEASGALLCLLILQMMPVVSYDNCNAYGTQFAASQKQMGNIEWIYMKLCLVTRQSQFK